MFSPTPNITQKKDAAKLVTAPCIFRVRFQMVGKALISVNIILNPSRRFQHSLNLVA